MNTAECSAIACERPEPDEFRRAMASFPSGVVIATTIDSAGRPWGFTASAFCSVSLDPPLVLVCLAKDADCHAAFTRARRLAMHVLHPGQSELALRFATKGVDKFAGEDFSPNAHGIPVLRHAPVGLDCTLHAQYDAGDHTVLISRVRTVTLAGRAPVVYYQRRFHPLSAGTT
jgi:flavin reductase ActVB